MAARAWQELAESREGDGAEPRFGERRILPVSCNISICINFPAEHRSGLYGLTPVEALLLGGNVVGHEQSADRPLAHDIAGQHLAKEPITQPACQAVVEDRRLG